ncbi:MAG: riboflavin synthase [Acidiferrobacterales bacterium]
MFTGIIEAVGTVTSCKHSGDDMQLVIDTCNLGTGDVILGDSIAVNGVCLTVVALDGSQFSADVSAETLAHTTLGKCKAGQRVNLEKALTPSSRLGGHLVSGHVDGVGVVRNRNSDGRSERFRIEAPQNLARYIARKGSICVDGISLTVNKVDANAFELNIVPHTLANTTMSDFVEGTEVNLEVDIIARYLERMLLAGEDNASGSITLEKLRQSGFAD